MNSRTTSRWEANCTTVAARPMGSIRQVSNIGTTKLGKLNSGRIRNVENVSNQVKPRISNGTKVASHTFIGAASGHFAGGHIEDTGVLDVGTLGEMEPNMDMV